LHGGNKLNSLLIPNKVQQKQLNNDICHERCYAVLIKKTILSFQSKQTNKLLLMM